MSVRDLRVLIAFRCCTSSWCGDGSALPPKHTPICTCRTIERRSALDRAVLWLIQPLDALQSGEKNLERMKAARRAARERRRPEKDW